MLSFECIKNEKSVYFLLTSAGHKKLDKTFALPNLHKQSPHLYSILIRRKFPLSALKISGCIMYNKTT